MVKIVWVFAWMGERWDVFPMAEVDVEQFRANTSATVVLVYDSLVNALMDDLHVECERNVLFVL